MKFALAFAAALCAASLSAQSHDMHAGQPAAVELEKNLGDFHYAVSAKSAEAQAFFDQGMRYLYAFNHESAVRSFARAAELDPALAMAHWGVALALGPNINMDVDPDREKQAYDAVHLAMTKLDSATAKEKDLIATLAKRYSTEPGADLRKLAVDYSNSMGELTKKYPDDLDIATLYAESMMDLNPWKLWAPDGTPREGTKEIVATLESVLKRNPRHLGANHYYIHAIEASPDPSKALASAKILPTLAPGAGHLVHMPAHIFERTGNYAGAAKANEEGAVADRAYIEKFGTNGMYVPMYYNHNLSFGAVSHAMQGDYASATRMIDEFGANVAEFAKAMPAAELMAAWPLLVRARFAKWDELLAAPDPKIGPASTALWHFARGEAFAGKGKLDDALIEEKALEAADLSPDPGIMLNSPKSLGAVAIATLRGRIAAAKGDWPGAIAAYREAVKAEDQLSYDEPPGWIIPSREALGAALLRSGKVAEAEQVFREDLKVNPGNPRSLFGLSAALNAQKKTAEARKVRAEYSKAWKGAALTIEDL